MADAAIDIYSAVAVLSRCSYAANRQSSFDYERKLAELYTLKVSSSKANLKVSKRFLVCENYRINNHHNNN